jgi:anti-sigma factor RsiW
MKQTQDSEGLIKRYLLGELSAAERAALEKEYLVDKAMYDQVCRIEDDLLDRYARGALTLVDHERVERQYLTNPWRRRHLEFAKVFTQVIDEEPTARSAAKRSTVASWRSKLAGLPRGLRGSLWMTTAAAALLAVFGGTWLAIESSRLRERLIGARREVEEQQQRAQGQARLITELETRYKKLAEENERLQAQLQAVQNTEPLLSHITPVFLTLSVDDFRGSGAQGPQALVIPRGATDARLRLYLPENAFPSYQVTLSTEDGNDVFSKNGLKPREDKAGDFVIVNLPVSKLRTGDSVLALSGISLTGQVELLGKSLIKVRRR